MPIGCHALGCWEEVLGVQRLIFFRDQLGDQNKEVEIDLQVVGSQHQGFCQQPCYSPHGQDASCNGSRLNCHGLVRANPLG